MGCPGEDGALGGCGRRLNELRGTLALSLTEKHILQPAPHAKPRSAPCAFPSRCGAREVWGNPPARLRGTMENDSTGQMRSSNPPPGCGAACARVRRSRFESGLTERRTLPNRRAPECAFPSRRDRRMRFSVRVPAQNALFRRVRFSLPGQTWRRLTEKRSLQPASHGKAHSDLIGSRIDALCVCWRTPKDSRPREVSDSHTSRERCE